MFTKKKKEKKKRQDKVPVDLESLQLLFAQIITTPREKVADMCEVVKCRNAGVSGPKVEVKGEGMRCVGRKKKCLALPKKAKRGRCFDVGVSLEERAFSFLAVI